MVTMDHDDLRIVLGMLAVSVAVLWAAVVLGAAVWLFRLIGGL
jgi:hypothetical protein